MIRSLVVRDYKSFRGEHEVPLRQLTVLLGKNNSGKTSLARLPLLLASLGAAESADGRPGLPLRVRGLNYGGDPRDLVFGGLTHGDFELGATYDPPVGGVAHLRVALQPLESLHGDSLVVARLDLTPALGTTLKWNRRSGSTDEAGYGDTGIRGFDGVLPIFADNRSEVVESIRRGFRKHLTRLHHLGSVRDAIDVVYEPRAQDLNMTSSGAGSALLLRSDRSVQDAVSAWYHLNAQIDVDVDEFGFGFRVTAGAERTNLAFAGQGIQQVFPVVCLLSAITTGRLSSDVAVVEEPELHLHPSVHGGVADLAIAASERSQVLVESHSENFCLRIRRRIAEGSLDRSRVLFVWCGSGEPGHVLPIEVGNDGSVNKWPRGVFSEDLAGCSEIAGEVDAWLTQRLGLPRPASVSRNSGSGISSE